MNIDVNCDMGENIGNDEEIMPYISSANIACGFHAGDATSMRNTIWLAKKQNVAVGAHPGWRDREGFGRREMLLPLDDVEDLVLYQISSLSVIAIAEGMELCHVKPHGALYNQAAKDLALAGAIVRAVKHFSGDLILVGLAGSRLIEAGLDAGLRVAREGFPDRNYHPDGTLISRKQENAIVQSSEEVAANAIRLAQRGIHIDGGYLRVDTLCLHGDHPLAAHNARLVHRSLKEAGINVITL